ncbi:GATA transcription factor [Quillaja saponaria]|uniref:GATA transcription factor n=1 Tax=Quillaja saponaria TaxID=32244 RepID=A0AAD7VM83_QUISA|nr:GATA transcription factor [Quillaja saponaria]
MSEGSWFSDKNFNGFSNDFFDDVINLFDFPLEDVEPNAGEEDWNTQFQQLEEPSLDVFAVPSSGLCGITQNQNPTIKKNISASYNDIFQLKQLPETAESTCSRDISRHNDSSDVKDLQLLQTYSPVSVFESSSTCSLENPTFDPTIIPAKRARSKRRRPSSFSSLLSIPFISTMPNLQDSHETSASYLSGKVSNTAKRKQRKKDLSMLSGSTEMKIIPLQEPSATRKCTHCQVTKTPQWREGPMGPKTLCNACGVRYRSGRLYPEYRPAASPTFVASVHSNCHKKVIEMRNKVNQEAARGSMKTSIPNLPRDSLEY